MKMTMNEITKAKVKTVISVWVAEKLRRKGLSIQISFKPFVKLRR